MNNTLWVMQCLLAAFFIMPGIGKISGSIASHVADGHLRSGSSIVPIRILGVLELLGCVGIIVPWLMDIAPVLTPVSAVGFCLVMASGLVNHTRKKEYKMLPMLGLVFVLAAIVAYYRFGLGASK